MRTHFPAVLAALLIMVASAIHGTEDWDPPTKSAVYKTFALSAPLELEVDLPATAKAPVILYVHSWSGNRNQLRAYSRRLSQAGVAGVRINYRKLSEGHSFEEAYADVNDALGWIRDNADGYGFDATRIGVAGASAGGLLAALLALENPDCLVYIGFNGGYDLLERDASRWPPADRMNSLLGTELPNNDLLREWSPIHRIRKDHQPAALLLHGTADEIIDFSVARRFAAALEAKGGHVQLVPFEGLGHGFFNPSQPSFEEVYARVWQHLKSYLLDLE